MILLPHRAPPFLLTFTACMIAAAAAVWVIEPPYLSYDPQPFSPLVLLALVAIALIPASGVALGGALANVTSAAIWPGVPNYVIVGHYTFNLADIAIFVGAVMIVAHAVGRWK